MIDLGHKNIIDVVKYRFVWIGLSLLLIIPGVIAMAYNCTHSADHMPLKVGIDFTGGTITQFKTKQNVDSNTISKIRKDLDEAGINNPQIQIISDMPVAQEIEKEAEQIENKKVTAQGGSFISIRSKFIDETNSEMFDKMKSAVKISVPDAELEQVNSVGPTLGAELFKNAITTLFIAFAIVCVYLAIRFQLDYALIALFGLAHDVLFICGCFALLGVFFGTEIDSLFVTAVLTIIGYSINDTIVTFDRIRENLRFYSKKATLAEIVNASVNQTIARSLNTSITTLLTLVALYLFGGVTTRDFVLAIIIGIVIGTYSSIFFAGTVLEWVKEKKQTSRVAAR